VRVAVIGAGGFVGSAFVRHLSAAGHEVSQVRRDNYDAYRGISHDVVVDAAANASKLLAERDPLADVERTVVHRWRTLHDFPAGLHLHISSVDVYDDLASPARTKESVAPDPAGQSHYGFHKHLAEQCVAHVARRWLIVRLAGMVGPGLKKNPVFDIVRDEPLRIHPDSRYQFLTTDDAAALSWMLVERGASNEIFNVCGDGLISPREIAALGGRGLNLTGLSSDLRPRIVDVSIDRLKRLAPVPSTRVAIERFLARIEVPLASTQCVSGGAR
jgi:nucleoside-diphosphate-sugar epimerase